MTNVLDLLKEDAKYRYIGVKDDLFTLHDISDDSSWSYDLPTLTRGRDYSKKKIQKNNKEFKIAFYNKLPFLKNIRLDNLLIAGGAIRSILLNSHLNDVDLFVHGINSVEAGQTRIEKLILDIYDNLVSLKNGTYIKDELNTFNKKMESVKPADKKLLKDEFEKKYAKSYSPNMKTDISVYSNGNTVTLFVNSYAKIQIILRLYSTPSEILHGFDLGSSAVGFDGTNVYFTSLSKFSFENMVNIMDCSRRSTTYENRLIKYFDDGFNIVIPNLDTRKLRTCYHKYGLNEVCELPYMIFSYHSINGKSINVEQFHKQNGNDVVTDYDFYGNLHDDGYNETKYMLLRFNLTELISGKNRFIVKIDLNDELSVLKSKGKSLNEWKLSFNKNIIDMAFIEWNYNNLISNLMNDNIPVSTVKKYFNIINVRDFVNDVYLSELGQVDKEKKISNLINQQKNKVKQDIANLQNNFGLNWITKNPTTQLTSSINPILEDKSMWYGEIYLNDEELLIRLEEDKFLPKPVEEQVEEHSDAEDEDDEDDEHEVNSNNTNEDGKESDEEVDEESDKEDEEVDEESDEESDKEDEEVDEESDKEESDKEVSVENNSREYNNSEEQKEISSNCSNNSGNSNNSEELEDNADNKSIKQDVSEENDEDPENSDDKGKGGQSENDEKNTDEKLEPEPEQEPEPEPEIKIIKKSEVEQYNFTRVMVYEDGTTDESGEYSGTHAKQVGVKVLNSIIKEFEIDNDTEVTFGVKDMNTNQIYWFVGSRQELDTPVTVSVKGKDVSYKYKSVVKEAPVPDCVKPKKRKERSQKIN
jgi:hypothetical protein